MMRDPSDDERYVEVISGIDPSRHPDANVTVKFDDGGEVTYAVFLCRDCGVFIAGPWRDAHDSKCR